MREIINHVKMKMGDNMRNQRMFSKIFIWMFIGLFVTGITSLYVVSNPNILLNVLGSGAYTILILFELGLVIFLSLRIKKMSYFTAAISFLMYALLTGITTASILIVYELNSLILMFGLTSFLFLVFGLIGFFTKVDLTKLGNILFMMLIGIIIAILVNFFLGNTIFDIIICSIGVLVFLGLVMYDIQKIKLLTANIENENQMAIFGALELYLDFINIFLYLLQLFGKHKD